MDPLLVIGAVFVGLAALIHVYIFYLESIAWSKPSTWRGFGLKSQAEADTVKAMAFNQGYYNAFLAAGVVIGLVLIGAEGTSQAGYALAIFSALSMVLAATVLVTSMPSLARGAAIQGVAPLIGVVFLLLSLAN